jgi:hypothetical protein
MIKCYTQDGEYLGMVDKTPEDGEYYFNHYTYKKVFSYGGSMHILKKVYFSTAIANSFRSHKLSNEYLHVQEELREKAKELAYIMDDLCPRGRELSLAMTNLEQALMWANKAIAVEHGE